MYAIRSYYDRLGVWDGLRDLLDGWPKRKTYGTEYRATGAPGLGAQPKALVLLLHFDRLERLEVSEHIGPLERFPGRLEAVEQRLAQDEREERAEDMAADGRVALVEDGAGLEQGLGGAKP